jgi:hypothetical protein
MNFTPDATPTPLPVPIPGSNGGAGDEHFPWGSLVSRTLHPIQVAVVEAMYWIRLPLSPSDVSSMLDGTCTASHVAYHVKALVDRGILQLVDTETVRGATRHLYVLAPESKWP